ncbi:EAL domain-containing protein [Pseudomonadota bacterium]
MTLARQVIVVLSILFMLVFVGTLFITLQNTREFLENQMGAHVRDTATSLALSLTSGMLSGDITLMDSVVNTAFESGNYKDIIVTRMNGNVLIERRLTPIIEGVPAWYMRRLPITTPVGESEIITDLRQAAKVFVRSHPGPAYHFLWRTSVEIFWWFVATTLLMVVVVVALIKLVLRPLRDLESQVITISNQEFIALDKIPRNREFNRLVAATNSMSAKVKSMLSEASDRVEKMRRQASEDSVTGLANRRGFDSQLNALIESKERFKRGLLCLIELDNLKGYNDVQGYARGDELLRTVADAISEVANKLDSSILAKIGGGVFAIVLENHLPSDAERIGLAFSKALGSVQDSCLNTIPDIGHIGISYYDGRKSLRNLLSEADMAVQAARLKGGNAWSIGTDDQKVEQVARIGSQEWKEILRRVIDNHEIILNFQPVFSCKDHAVIHHEVLVRLPGDGDRTIPARMFVPMAERLNLSTELDMAIVESAMVHLVAHSGVNYAVNISASSIGDEHFCDWLVGITKGYQDIAARLIFETSEQSIKENLEGAVSLRDRLRKIGSDLAVDHFGQIGGSFGYLVDLKPSYLKIDGSHFRDLVQYPNNQFYLQAIAEMAHTLQIQVIAGSVETKEDFNCVKKLNIDAAQGYFLGRPKSVLFSE